VHVISDVAIMLHDDAGVQNAVVLDYRVRVHNNTGHYNGSTADPN
jgi:hypothetical protein